MIDLDGIYDALTDAFEHEEISELEAADEWRWTREEFFREVRNGKLIYVDNTLIYDSYFCN